MAHDIIPHQESLLDEWEANFAAKLAADAVTLGIDPSLVATITAAITDHHNAYANAVVKKDESKAADAAKDEKKGIAVNLIRDAARKCKASSAYTDALGKELGIVAQEQTLDLANAKPEVTHISQLIDMIILDFIKKHLDGVAVYGAEGTRLHGCQHNSYCQ